MTDKAELLDIADRLSAFALAEGCPTAAMRHAAAILRKLAGKPERKAQAGFDAADALAAKDVEMQAALERIADLKALLARARQSMYSVEPLALAVDTALAGKPERKAQDDGGYDIVAAWDRSGLLYPDDMVDPVFQAGWDAARSTT